MLKQWVQNENLADIDIEEKYCSWVQNLRSGPLRNGNLTIVLWVSFAFQLGTSRLLVVVS